MNSLPYHLMMIVQVTSCVLLILVVLMQAGRGAGLSVFGGGGGDAMFQTPSGTSFMRQLTGWLAATFAAASLLLTIIGGRTGMSSVTTSYPTAPMPQQAPALPGGVPATAPSQTAPATPEKAPAPQPVKK